MVLPRISRAQDFGNHGSVTTGTDLLTFFTSHLSVTLFSDLGAGRNMTEPDAFEQERDVGTVAIRPCSAYQITRLHPISDGTKKLTRAGIAETVSRDQILPRERGKGTETSRV